MNGAERGKDTFTQKTNTINTTIITLNMDDPYNILVT